MSLSMYDLSVPVFLRGLEIVDEYCDTAVEFAAKRGIEPSTLVDARLAPDMLPLSGQVQCASDGSRRPVGRLAGIAPPRFEDVEKSFPELKLRIANTMAFLRNINPDRLAGSENRQIDGKFWGHEVSGGREYLLSIALPNFYFHVATAHDILRYSGVPLGKRDYLFLSREIRDAISRA
jgi:hypothetical protein